MRLRQDDAERLLRRAGRLPKAGVAIAGGIPAASSTETADDPPGAESPHLCQHEQDQGIC
jgi:hypothetical protein